MKYPNDADGQALANVAASGMDMSQPIPIEFAIAAPDESSSEEISAAVSTKGYRVESYFDEGESDFVEGDDDEFGPSWTVYAIVITEPSYENVVQIQSEIDQLVSKLGGKSDGWELKVTQAK